MKIPTLILAASLGFIGGCSTGWLTAAPGPVVETQDPDTDYAAIAFFDCGQLLVVEFISFGGKFQQVPVQGAASLMDLQLRMSKVDYNRVQYVQNQRPCGFAADEKDAL